MKFFEEQKDKILEVLYEIYDDWQRVLDSSIKNRNVDDGLIEQYENNLNTALDFIEYFKATGELDIPHILLWSICNHAIFHSNDKDGD